MNPYLQKDLKKISAANKFIGFGEPSSSTEKYRKRFGTAANTGDYTHTDRVFVSINGTRPNRVGIEAYREEIKKAADAQVTFIADTAANRKRAYNLGERELAALLEELGYVETSTLDYSIWYHHLLLYEWV